MTSIIVQPGATEADYQITVTINEATYEIGASFAVGPRGPAGVSMTGPWDAGTAYLVDDGVYRNGSSYWARQASTGVDPETDVDPETGLGTYWNLMAAEGKPGDVQGPATSTAGHMAVWGDTAGAVLTDGGAPLTLGTTAGTALAGDTTAADIGGLSAADSRVPPTPDSVDAGKSLVVADGGGWELAGAWTPTWTTLSITGGTTPDAGHVPLRYCKDPTGFVHIEGSLKFTSVPSGTLFTLPAGYRPAGAALTIAVLDTGTSSYAYLMIKANGTGVIAAAGGSGTISVVPMVFYAAS